MYPTQIPPPDVPFLAAKIIKFTFASSIIIRAMAYEEDDVMDYFGDDREHQMLTKYLKEVHSSLRKSASKLGAEKAWHNHCENKERLRKYAHYMEKLATEHWENSHFGPSRIFWATNFCMDYFIEGNYLTYREKEKVIATKCDVKLEAEESFMYNIKLLDVGSCYNPFNEYEDFLNVTAIDLCPANDSVLECDILSVPIGTETIIKDAEVKQFKEQSFDAITFCFVLEYIPSSELRISACKKAYSLLKPGGVMIIITPDSKHAGANYKLMKCWRYALAQLGFCRIKYEKYRHMHCMAFRKSLHKVVAFRWALIFQEPYMKFAINIPQDFHDYSETEETYISMSSPDDFKEMPFCDEEIP